MRHPKRDDLLVTFCNLHIRTLEIRIARQLSINLQKITSPFESEHDLGPF